jgi:hypothetical protein
VPGGLVVAGVVKLLRVGGSDVAVCDGPLTFFGSAIVARRLRVRIGHALRGSGHSEEPAMRRLWYRDSYGRWHEDRRVEGRSGTSARWAVITLVVLAGIVVFASMIH